EAFADAISLISHDDQSFFAKICCINRLAIQQCCENREGGRLYRSLDIDIINPYPGEGSHGSLYNLRIECVYRIHRTDNVVYTEPFGSSDDRSKISGILYIIQYDAVTAFQLAAVKMFRR